MRAKQSAAECYVGWDDASTLQILHGVRGTSAPVIDAGAVHANTAQVRVRRSLPAPRWAYPAGRYSIESIAARRDTEVRTAIAGAGSPIPTPSCGRADRISSPLHTSGCILRRPPQNDRSVDEPPIDELAKSLLL